jgi:hypothetical protein
MIITILIVGLFSTEVTIETALWERRNFLSADLSDQTIQVCEINFVGSLVKATFKPWR